MILEEILSNKIVEDRGYETPCDIWQGSLVGKGYGQVYFEGEYWLLHRLIFKLNNANFEPCLCVLHKCDVMACFKYEHLFQGTIADNNHDRHNKGHYSRHTFCKQGHKLTEENIYTAKTGKRSCKICRQNRNKISNLIGQS